MLQKKLSELIQSMMTKNRLEIAYFLASDMIEQGMELPDELETQLINFMTEKNEEAFVLLSKAILTNNLLHNYNMNIRLISFLTERKWVTLEDAALLLSSIPYVARVKLPKDFRRALEVADLVCEDSHDGIMDAGDDDLLTNALKKINWEKQAQDES